MNYTFEPKDIIFADLDPTEGVLLNLKSKNYYKLNETGQIIWKGLEKKLPIEAIATTLTDTYALTHEQAVKDVYMVVEKLIFENILQEDKPATTFSIEKAHASKMGKQPL